MGSEVVRLDVVDVGGGLELRDLVQLAHVVLDVGELADGSLAALEVDDVDFIEADECHVESDVCFGDAVIAGDVSAMMMSGGEGGGGALLTAASRG